MNEARALDGAKSRKRNAKRGGSLGGSLLPGNAKASTKIVLPGSNISISKAMEEKRRGSVMKGRDGGDPLDLNNHPA